VRLDGNDYLNLTGHPDIVRAQTDALRCDGEFVIQSSVFLLDSHPARSLEKSLARWIGKEDGLICQSGYSANLGLLQAIADPRPRCTSIRSRTRLCGKAPDGLAQLRIRFVTTIRSIWRGLSRGMGPVWSSWIRFTARRVRFVPWRAWWKWPSAPAA
jgi:hypothetical protein